MEIKKYPFYKCSETKVAVSGEEYNAVFVENHSSVEAVILELKDSGIWDDRKKVREWRVRLFSMKKNSCEWNLLYKGSLMKCPKRYNVNGIFPLLFSIETKDSKRRWLEKIISSR